TFQEIKKTGNSADMAGAAFAIGAALARVHGIDSSRTTVASRRGLEESFELSLASPILEQRIGRTERLHDLLSRWRPRLRGLDASRTLVHGDFNNRNTIVRQVGDAWVVAAILDWELAFTGTPWWDAARFVCYEHADRPCREPFFSNGYRENGGKLPEDWPRTARVINAVSAVRSLADAGTPDEFVEDLRELVEQIVTSGV
ncbi:MAG TPA: phosphotransferase, partial [Bryobacteraceae bacterium]|nr:phosphotransferase [Bryobacteraceae bacterium]